MTNGDKEVDEYRAELNERVDDGGGCAEMWDALSEAREAGSVDSRRSILKKTAGAIGVSAVGLSTLADTAAATTKATNVTEKQGASKHRIVSRALRDHRVKQIAQQLKSEGYDPQIDEARVTSSNIQLSRLNDEEKSNIPTDVRQNNSWTAAVIPFGPTKDNVQSHITWTTASAPTHQVVGRISEHISPRDGAEPYWNIQNVTVNQNGDVHVESEKMLNFLGCSNVNTGCIALIAAAYGSEFIACATCGASAGWLIPACGYCITAVLAAYGTSVTCNWCND